MQFGAADHVEITAKGNVDAVYQHDSVEATAEIAKRIISGATDESLTPTEAHPIAAALKNDPKFSEKIEQDALTKSGVSSESFVERLGLKHVETKGKSHVGILIEKHEQKIRDAANPNCEKSR